MGGTWTGFFTALAEISATLVALLFVSIQVRHDLWVTSELRKHLAIGTLLEFLTPAIVSVGVLAPLFDWQSKSASIIPVLNSLPTGIVEPLQHIALWHVAGCLLGGLGIINGTWFAVLWIRDARDAMKAGKPTGWLRLLRDSERVMGSTRWPFLLTPLLYLEYGFLIYSAVNGFLTLAAIVLLWLVFSGSFETWWFFSEPTPNN